MWRKHHDDPNRKDCFDDLVIGGLLIVVLILLGFMSFHVMMTMMKIHHIHPI